MAPANDLFVNAQLLTGDSGTTAGSTNSATGEAGEAYASGGYSYTYGIASVWYRWTPSISMDIMFNSVPTGGYGDVFIDIGTGTASNAYSVLVTAQSRVIASVLADTEYYIRLVAYYGGPYTGTFNLSWAAVVPPANDAFADAAVITGVSGVFTGSNLTATLEVGEPASVYEGTNSVWHRWTPVETMIVKFWPDYGYVDAYTGVSVDALTQAVPGNGDGKITFEAIGGIEYFIRYDTYNAFNAQLSYTLSWRQVNPPANDHFVNAQVITGASGSLTGSNLDASFELSEPVMPHGSGESSIWYRWTAPSTAEFAFDTIGSRQPNDDLLDTVLFVYRGSAVGALTLVAMNDETGVDGYASMVRFTATAGTVYQIRICGYGDDDQGVIAFNWSPAPPFPLVNLVDSADTLLALGDGPRFNGSFFDWVTPEAVIAASQDGVTWRLIDTPFDSDNTSTEQMVSIGSSIVITGNLWSYFDEDAADPVGIGYSIDGGVTWGFADSPFRHAGLEQDEGWDTWTWLAAGGNEVFVVGGWRYDALVDDGVVCFVTASASDPSAWTTIPQLDVLTDMDTLEFLDGVFVLAGETGEWPNPRVRVMYTSIDGTSWTLVDPYPFGTDYVTSFATDGSRWLAAGNDLSYSDDVGATWTQISESGITNPRFVAYGDGVWVVTAAEQLGKVMFRSTDDGMTWVPASVDPFGAATSSAGIYGLDRAGGQFWATGRVAISGTKMTIASSPDGDIWTRVTNPFETTSNSYATAVQTATPAVFGQIRPHPIVSGAEFGIPLALHVNPTLHGNTSLALISRVNGIAIATFPVSEVVSILPGLTYSAAGSFRAEFIGRPIDLAIQWFDIDGDELDIIYADQITDTTNGWIESVADSVVAPPDALSARLLVRIVGTAVDEVHFLGEPWFGRGPYTEWAAPGPNVVQVCKAVGIQPGGVGTPAIGNATIFPVSIPSGEVVAAPDVFKVLGGSGISSAESFGTPTVIVRTDWWSARWPYRCVVTLGILGHRVAPAGHPVVVALPMTIKDQGKMRADFADVEVLHFVGEQWKRLSRATTQVGDRLEVRFLADQELTPLLTDTFYMYYGAPTATGAGRNSFEDNVWPMRVDPDEFEVGYTRPTNNWVHGVSTTRGAKAALALDATMVRILADREPAAGIAEIQLDDGLWESVDLFSPVEHSGAEVWRADGLSTTEHRVRFRVSGTMSPGASGVSVNLVAFEFVAPIDVQVGPEEVLVEVWGERGVGGG